MCLLLSSRPIAAQTTPVQAGAIRGRVVDAGGAPVRHAQVVARDERTGAERGAGVDDAGRYVVRPLAAGRYTVRVRALGFEPLNESGRVLLRPEPTFRDGRQLAAHQHRLLLMVDELPSYGRLDVFQESLAYIAGYGIKAYLIAQDVAQLWAAYGRDETILSNCHGRVAYAPNKVETGEWLSKQAGTATVVKEDISTSGRRFGAVLDHVTRAYHEVSRPMLTADEAMRLRGPVKNGADEITEPGDVLVFVAGYAPILGTQSLFFRDPVFRERARVPAPATDTLSLTGPAERADAAAGVGARPGRPALVEPFRL